MISLTINKIDLEAAVKDISTPESGGIDIFIGTTRNNSHGRAVLMLEYEAYEPMAIKMMTALEREAREHWPLQKVAMIHRLGKVPVGEASVVIAVSSSHRAEAFEACRFLIDKLKKDVPIWKREHFTDGEVVWSGPQPADSFERTGVE